MSVETIKGKLILTARDQKLKDDPELLLHMENYINHNLAQDLYIKYGVLIRVHLNPGG
jgi:hypothetical protein